MAPLRDALEVAGLTDVASFGSSGNLVFCADSRSCKDVAIIVSTALGQEVIARSRAQLSDIVMDDPYFPRPDANTFLFEGALDQAPRVLSEARGAEGLRPIAGVGVVYFAGRPQLPGRLAMVDFERELGVRGTMRTSKVMERVLAMM